MSTADKSLKDLYCDKLPSGHPEDKDNKNTAGFIFPYEQYTDLETSKVQEQLKSFEIIKKEPGKLSTLQSSPPALYKKTQDGR